MSSSFLKIISSTYIFINLFIISECSVKPHEDYNTEIYNFTICKEDGYTTKFILDNQGNISKSCDDIKNEGISSLVINEELLIYNYQLKNVACNYYSTYPYANSLEDCRKLNTSDNNLCCFLRETEYNENSFTTSRSCIEVDKYEIDRFKGINSKKFEKFIDDTIPGKFYLECHSSFYKSNKIIFYLLFLYLYF